MDTRKDLPPEKTKEAEKKPDKAAIIELLTKIVPDLSWHYSETDKKAWVIVPKAIASSIFEFICYAFETYPYTKVIETHSRCETMLATKYGVVGEIGDLSPLKDSQGIYIKPISGEDKDLYSALLTISKSSRLSDLQQNIKKKSKKNDLIVRIIIDKFEGHDRFIEYETNEKELRSEIAEMPFLQFSFETGRSVSVPSLEFERKLNQLASQSSKMKSFSINLPELQNELIAKLNDILEGKGKDFVFAIHKETNKLSIAIQLDADQFDRAFEKLRVKCLLPDRFSTYICIDSEKAYKILIYGEELLKRVKQTFTAEINEKYKWVLGESHIAMRMIYPKQKEDEKNKKIIAVLEKMIFQLKVHKIFAVLEETSTIPGGGYRIIIPIEQSLSTSTKTIEKAKVGQAQAESFLASHQAALTSGTSDARLPNKESVSSSDTDTQRPTASLR